MSPKEVRYVTPEELGFPTQTLERPRFTYPTRIASRHNRHTAIPLLGSGPCLEPWFRDDDVIWYTPNIEPKDGDLVAVDIEFGRAPVNQATGLREDTGERTILTCIKQFRIVHGWIPQLTCNQAAIMLDNKTHKILGVVTAWRRRQWWRRPSLKGMTFPIVTDCHLMMPGRIPGRL